MTTSLTARMNLGKTNGENAAEDGPDARPTKQMGHHRRRGTSA